MSKSTLVNTSCTGENCDCDPLDCASGTHGLREYTLMGNPINKVSVQARIIGGHAAERSYEDDDCGSPNTIMGK